MNLLGIRKLTLPSFIREPVYNPHRKLKFRLPKIYLASIVLGFTLTGLKYTVFPSLVFCLKIFDGYCDPVGNYLFTLSSWPGYITATLLPPADNLSPQTLFFTVVGVSLMVYFLIGLLIDKFRTRNFKIFRLENIILTVFIILVLMALILLF